MRAISILALAGLLALGGYAAEAQTGPPFQDLRTQLLICLARIEGNPRYARVYEKLGVATASDLRRMPTPKQLSDTEVISDSDIAIGLEWYAQLRTCTAPVNQAAAKRDPNLQVSLVDIQNNIKGMIDDIIIKK